MPRGVDARLAEIEERLAEALGRELRFVTVEVPGGTTVYCADAYTHSIILQALETEPPGPTVVVPTQQEPAGEAISPSPLPQVPPSPPFSGPVPESPPAPDPAAPLPPRRERSAPSAVYAPDQYLPGSDEERAVEIVRLNQPAPRSEPRWDEK